MILNNSVNNISIDKKLGDVLNQEISGLKGLNN